MWVALLRGVTPVGKNKIPSMSYLREILIQKGLENLSTYIQSGNIIFNSKLHKGELIEMIHRTILDEIGADVSVVLKKREQLLTVLQENPFDSKYDFSRIHVVFTNQIINKLKLGFLEEIDYGREKLVVGSECIYIYLPKDVSKNKLNTNYLERKLKIVATTRKMKVIAEIYNIFNGKNT